MEKITVTPECIRCGGNIISPAHELEDYTVYHGMIQEESATVNNITQQIFRMSKTKPNIRISIDTHTGGNIIMYKGHFVVTATVTDENNNPLPNMMVNLVVNDSVVNENITNSEGITQFDSDDIDTSVYLGQIYVYCAVVETEEYAPLRGNTEILTVATIFTTQFKNIGRIKVFSDFETTTFTDSPVIEKDEDNNNMLVLNYGHGYTACIQNQGWDNTLENWQFECDMMQNNWDSGFELLLGIAEKYMDYTPYRILRIPCASDYHFCIAGRQGAEYNWTYTRWADYTYSENKWKHLTIIKKNNLFTIKIDEDTVCSNKVWPDSENYDIITFGGACWGNSNGTSDPSGVKIKNVIVCSLEAYGVEE